MKSYGKSSKIRANLKDVHPPKGYVNWWEVEFGRIDKGSERQKAKIEIRKKIDEQDNQSS